MKTNLLKTLSACALSLSSIMGVSAQNLVSNGNFSTTTASIGSDLSASTATCIAGESKYLIAPNFQNKCSGWPSVYDHTSGNSSGNFVMIDMGNSTAALKMWSQSVSVTSGVVYRFSFWANPVYSPTNHPFKLTMNVNTSTIYTTPDISPTNGWSHYESLWTATSTGTVTLSIAILALPSGDIFRDFGIDDVFFGADYCNPDFSTQTNHVGGSSDYKITATPIINPASYSDLGWYWDVREVNGSGVEVPNTLVINPDCWWLNSTSTFIGYDYNVSYTSSNNTGSAFNGVYCTNPNDGKFHTGHIYKITRGTWSNNCNWQSISHTVAVLSRPGKPDEIVDIKSEISFSDPRIMALLQDDESKIIIYPNPSNGQFTLNTQNNDAKDIYVYDLMGKVVFNKNNTMEQSFLINISDLPRGIYLVKVIAGSKMQTQRVINE